MGLVDTQIYAFVLGRLKAGGSKGWPDLALRSRVPLATIQKIAHEHTKNPRVRTVEALARGLIEQAGTQ
jgi:hypothetical protein